MIPRVRGAAAWFFIVLSTVIVFSILVKLGFWQLERGEQKQQWQAALSERQASAEFDYSQLLALPKTENPTGFRLTTQATPAMQHIFLLDNQVLDRQVGYLAYQVFEISPTQPWLLVELGFVAGEYDRAVLPSIEPVNQPLELKGRVYQKESNPMSSQLMAESGWPKRIQNLNLEQLSLLIDHPLASSVLQPSNLPNDTLPHPWQPIPLSAQKHQGYAVQWFSMAGVFGFIMLYLLFRKLKQ
ncbi:SURF1 family protein [Shewanella sp. UCD-KL12]|uniref:SURF1 family protein n=1 Tax=Shewanella sp. UCD-KL12 TaxID=1917163 RepID=UPI000971380C|nr:SURF1 family protein [Shewanella sp. UCD-KL12]